MKNKLNRLSLNAKLTCLKKIISRLESAVAAFSGGVDSSVLLKAAQEALGRDNVLAVTVRSAFVPEREIREAREFAEKSGVRHKVISIDVLKDRRLRHNPVNRCYLCKKTIMRRLLSVARQNRLKHVIEGSNTDDRGSFRPGKKALAELGILSPLAEAGLNKREIRALARQMGLENWNKHSASCLAARFAYGSGLTLNGLKRVEQAELLLTQAGFTPVRVRAHGEIARIEVDKKEINKLIRVLGPRMISRLKKTGFSFISVDAEGYRSGSFDEAARA